MVTDGTTIDAILLSIDDNAVAKLHEAKPSLTYKFKLYDMTRCPFCGCDDFTLANITSQHRGTVYSAYHCNECEHYWIATFELKHVAEAKVNT